MDSVYLKVLNELDKMSNSRSRYSNLIKIRNKTEDTVLSDLISNYCGILSYEIRYTERRLFMKAKEIQDKNKCNKESLRDYCHDKVKEGKPEWQVLAERNGWGPLNKKEKE